MMYTLTTRWACTFAVAALSVAIHTTDVSAQETLVYLSTEQINAVEVGTTREIRYEYENVDNSPVRLEYSTDSMRTWSLLSTLPTVTTFDSFAWTIPDEPTLSAFVRITIGGGTGDTTQKFAIVRGPLIVAVGMPRPPPVAGQVSEINISNPFITGGTFFLDYSFDSTSWTFMGPMIVRLGESKYTWTVPASPAERVYVRVRYDGVVRGVSAPFAIAGRGTPAIDIHAPSPGVVLYSGRTVAIAWSLLYPEELDSTIIVEYAARPGAAWVLIAQVPRRGFDSVIWRVPTDTTSFGQLRVRSADGSLWDTTSANFIIRPEPYVRLIHPNGGEILEVNSQSTITWDARSINGHYTLQYSLDSGRYWYTIATRHRAREGRDSIAWLVPSPTNPATIIRIFHEEGTHGDTTDGSFQIIVTFASADDDSFTDALDATLFPNPTDHGHATLRWVQRSSANVTLTLYAGDGTIALQRTVGDFNKGSHEVSLDFNVLPSGTYRFVLDAGSHESSGALIIRR